jgi:hypothetical protein
LSDLAKRDQLLKAFSDNTFGLMVATEAARAAIQNGTTVDEELNKMKQELGVPEEVASYSERSESASAAFAPCGNENGYPRRLPLLGMPIWVSMNCRKVIVRLFDKIDIKTKPGFIAAISEREIEERAAACHLTMCWYLAALSTPNKSEEIALRWVKEIPTLVRVMTASATRPSMHGFPMSHSEH